jgi:DNA-binding transcriptional MocR family regulator
MNVTLYSLIAENLQKQIREGALRAGDRIPSVRKQAQLQQVSIATINMAYNLLEDKGWIESRPKSGYYVRRMANDSLRLPTIPGQVDPKPRPANLDQLVMEVQRDAAERQGASMSSAIPALDFPILSHIQKLYTRISRTHKILGAGYGSPEGHAALRQQIARRSIDAGFSVAPDNLITTAGCQNALYLCLQVLTQKDDIVAVESPCYYGLLQMIEALGLHAIEIPARSDTGMSLEALKLALSQWPVKAILTVANFSNPTGSLMPDEAKAELVEMADHFDVPIIEDDLYGDLYFGETRPKAIKAFDTQGRVLLCSSMSKTLDPQLRNGWVAPGRYQDALLHRKFIHTFADPILPQQVLAEVINSGLYDRHLRMARETYHQRSLELRDLVARHFPSATRISQPQGGLVSWIELPKSVNTTRLYHIAHQEGILFAPGEMFSASNQYSNCMRISYAQGWAKERTLQIARLGELVKTMMQEK